jgi:hypothetical protein
MKKISTILSNDAVKATVFLVVFFAALGVVVFMTWGK